MAGNWSRLSLLPGLAVRIRFRFVVAAELVPAELGNDAGIVGAALAGAGK